MIVVIVLFRCFIIGLVCYVLDCFIVFCYRGTGLLVLYYCVCVVVCIRIAAVAGVVSGYGFYCGTCVLVFYVLQVLLYGVSCYSVLLLYYCVSIVWYRSVVLL